MKTRLKNFLISEYRNIYLFYLMTMAINAFFISSNWIYFWTKFMTFGQLGIIDAIGFGFGLLLEVPSGAIADLLGKKKTILFGFLAGGIGTFAITISSSIMPLFIGLLIAQFAYAFYSGAAEALAYDTLKDLKLENTFDKVISKNNSYGMYAVALTTLIGGFLYGLHFRLPQLLWSLSFFIGLILSFFLIEPKTDTEKFSLKNYIKQIIVGIKELFQPQLRKFTIFFFTLTGAYYVYSWGFIRPAIATSFGFYAREQAIILPILTLLGASAIRVVPKLRKYVKDYMGLVILSVIMALSFIIASYNIGYYGIFIMLFIAISGNFAYPWLSIVVNKRVDSKYRATTLSTAALINRIPYVLIAVTAGNLIEQGQLNLFNKGAGIIILLGLGLSYLFTRAR